MNTQARILVVDDEDMVLRVTQRLLEQIGYQTVGMRDGLEAIAYMRKIQGTETTVAAAIVDENLPNGLSGRETLRIIRRICPSIGAILTSGDLSGVRLVADPGFDTVISKPYDAATLKGTIQCLLARKKAAAPSA